MAKRRFSRAVGPRKGPKNLVWASVLASSQNVGTGTFLSFNIVQDNDWVRASGLERATLLRIRGWWSWITKDATGSHDGGPIFAYIGIYDEDETSADPSQVATYGEEDILWTSGLELPFTDSGAGQTQFNEKIDVKAMRRIRKGQEVRLVIANKGVSDGELTLLVRGLLTIGGN